MFHATFAAVPSDALGFEENGHREGHMYLEELHETRRTSNEMLHAR